MAADFVCRWQQLNRVAAPSVSFKPELSSGHALPKTARGLPVNNGVDFGSLALKGMEIKIRPVRDAQQAF